MTASSLIKGFSKLDRKGRMAVLGEKMDKETVSLLDDFLHKNPELQTLFSEFSENYLSNYYLPFGVIPNVLVNGKNYLVPAVIEESSVLAAASRSSRFWAGNGGFKTEIIGTEKKGQVHFLWKGRASTILNLEKDLIAEIKEQTFDITKRMRARGGGIKSIALLNLGEKIEHYYQLDVSFNTADAMGANFINSCLERMAEVLLDFVSTKTSEMPEVIMSILSNYTPNSRVRCSVSCPVEQLKPISGNLSADKFAQKFVTAVDIARKDISRAVTHNKGIYNGIDAVVLATGNDWRAVEAAGHAYAAKDGIYSGMGHAEIRDAVFTYTLEIPMAIGTVGGLTGNHPLAKFGMKMLGMPDAQELMQIIAAVGMANNFSAIASLITSGIQKGHMKMHLSNMLNQMGATEIQKKKAKVYFEDKAVSHKALADFLQDKT